MLNVRGSEQFVQLVQAQSIVRDIAGETRVAARVIAGAMDLDPSLFAELAPSGLADRAIEYVDWQYSTVGRDLRKRERPAWLPA